MLHEGIFYIFIYFIDRNKATRRGIVTSTTTPIIVIITNTIRPIKTSITALVTKVPTTCITTISGTAQTATTAVGSDGPLLSGSHGF